MWLTGPSGQGLLFGKRERDASGGVGASPATVRPHHTVVAAARSSAMTEQGRVGDTEVEGHPYPGGYSHTIAGITTGK